MSHYLYAQVFSSMKELLHKAPMLKSTVGKSRSELHRHWSEWKKMGSQKKASGVFLTLPQLHLLAKVRGREGREGREGWVGER